MPINRRRHRMFVTNNTEYHLRLDECVGVRDRETGAWHRHHAALRLRAIQIPPMGHDHCWIGKRLQFWGAGQDVVTSPVVEVGRPDRDVLPRYVSLELAGTIAA
ncbi:hypothetical protein [Paraliomyxa miuraensis]|uniref:hypothetical protein n=1 Tax=Paraliomyxa miuraensis TaxID=376150 RepID=UPI002254B177|nr:hypothetical protein [Paraliomyxa miuraensis]MCX4242779.1 hypothetical protein [Paraliomyxa miuraensis]